MVRFMSSLNKIRNQVRPGFSAPMALLSISIVLSCMSCGLDPKSVNSSRSNNQISHHARNPDPDLETLQKLLHSEGQPGLVLMKGGTQPFPTGSPGPYQLDQRVQVEQILGDASGQLSVNYKLQLAPASNIINLTEAENLNTYLNLGCDKLKSELIKNKGTLQDDFEKLEEIKVESLKTVGFEKVLVAKYIYVCNKQEDLRGTSLTLVAQNIIFMNARIDLYGNFFTGFQMRTNQLSLVGVNRISTTGTEFNYAGPFVSIGIRNQIMGQGHLNIKTIGASPDKK